jgi:hypothetical protein
VPDPIRLSRAELDAESAQLLPAKEVLSLLNLDIDLDVVLDLAAPIDLAVAANANVAAPIDAAVAANVLTVDSTAQALGGQDVQLAQTLSGTAEAQALQDAAIADGGATTADPAETVPTSYAQEVPVEEVDGALDGVDETVDDLAGTAADAVGEAIAGLDTGGLLQDGLLNVHVDAAVDAALDAPIAGAVAANANVAAPISASVAANIGSIGSSATAVADQTAVIVQELQDVSAEAVADQSAEISR